MKQLSLTIPTEDGQLRPSEAQKQAMTGYLLTRSGKAVVLRLSAPINRRSNTQNSFYWGVVLETIAADTGHTSEEIHEVFKAQFLPRKFVTVGFTEVQLPKSTTELSTIEFEQYLEQIRAWCSTELGISIPIPNEEINHERQRNVSVEVAQERGH